MGRKTNYRRLWRREQKRNKALHDQLHSMRLINESQAKVLERVRDGEIKPSEIFKEKKSG